MIVRVRTPAGMLRLEAEPNDRLSVLQQKVSFCLAEKKVQHKGLSLFRAPMEPGQELPLGKTADELGFRDGELLQATYVQVKEEEKELPPELQPVIRDPVPKCTAHGEHGSCIRCINARYLKYRQQKQSAVSGVEADKKAVSVFQYNMGQNLAFSVQRLGLLYGSLTEEGWVRVEAIYEPPQENTAHGVLLHTGHAQLAHAEEVARGLGMARVGVIIGQTAEDYEDEEFVLSSSQMLLIASLRPQKEKDNDQEPPFVILTVGARDEGANEVEAFELSEQFYDLHRRRYFLPSDDDFMVKMKEPIWLQTKEAKEMPVDYFIVTAPLKGGEGRYRSEFPVENRRQPQENQYLKMVLNKHKDKTMAEALADFHLLLFLVPSLGLQEVVLMAECIRQGTEVPEGAKLLVQSVAGML